MDRPPSAPGTARHRRQIRRVLVIACASLGLLLLAAVAIIHTPLVTRYVLGQVTQLLAAQQIVVTTDELDYNLFDLSLSLRDAVVRAADPPDGPPFASIARARVDLSLFQLLRGHYVVESAVLDGLTVHYFVREDGTDNLPRPLRTPDAPTEPIAYLIDSLSTQDASVRYEDRLRRVDVTLPIARLAIDGNRMSGRHRDRVRHSPDHRQRAWPDGAARPAERPPRLGPGRRRDRTPRSRGRRDRRDAERVHRGFQSPAGAADASGHYRPRIRHAVRGCRRARERRGRTRRVDYR